MQSVVQKITTTVDNDGNLVETSCAVIKSFLLIDVVHKSADEMAKQHRFTTSQKKQLAELLRSENDGIGRRFLVE